MTEAKRAILVLEQAYGPTAQGPWETRGYTVATLNGESDSSPTQWSVGTESGWGWRKPEQKFWRWRCLPYVPESTPPAEAKAEGDWVACSERMPVANLLVLVAIRIGHVRSVEMGAYDKTRHLWVTSETDVANDGTELSRESITHWMPLPAPPKLPEPR